jgi:mono/diheme cytochrome c family protein
MRALLLACVVMLMAAACYNSTSGDTEIPGIAEFKLPVLPKTGSHKVMVFSEMHYQPSFRVQEGPRLLPASQSVAFAGLGAAGLVTQPDMIRIEPQIASVGDAQLLELPQEFADSYDATHAAELYRVNCAVCHGLTLDGNSLLTTLMKDRGVGPLPANLNSAPTQNASDGELFAFITKGGRQGFALTSAGRESNSPMPPFSALLSQEDRWALVSFLRSRRLLLELRRAAAQMSIARTVIRTSPRPPS